MQKVGKKEKERQLDFPSSSSSRIEGRSMETAWRTTGREEEEEGEIDGVNGEVEKG